MEEAKATGNGCLLEGSLTSLDPNILTVFGGHAHQEALPLGCLHLMQIVPWGLEYLVQETTRTSRPCQLAQRPTELQHTLPLSQEPNGNGGVGTEQLVINATHPHDLLLVRGYHVLPQHLLHHMLPLGGLRHAGSCPRRWGVGHRGCQLPLLSFLDGRFRTEDWF